MSKQTADYKAWHPSTKEMVAFDFDKIARDNIAMHHFCMLAIDKHEEGKGLLHRYSGLKDKKGVEIYFDCEIFKFKWMTSPTNYDSLIGVMRWSDEELRAEVEVYPVDNDSGYVVLSYIGNGQMYDFKVIGNIHQHHSLLEDK